MQRTAAFMTGALRAAPGADVRVTPAETGSAVFWRILSCVLRLLSRARRACYGGATEHRGERQLYGAEEVPMLTAKPIPGVYHKLGVRPIIHGAGTTTRYGGSLMRPETIAAMREASQAFVNIDELNEAAGAAIARMLGAEAAFVTGGAAAGLVLQAAACITGEDAARVAQLPDTTGMKHEFIIQRAHRFMYDQAFRVAGGVLV